MKLLVLNGNFRGILPRGESFLCATSSLRFDFLRFSRIQTLDFIISIVFQSIRSKMLGHLPYFLFFHNLSVGIF